MEEPNPLAAKSSERVQGMFTLSILLGLSFLVIGIFAIVVARDNETTSMIATVAIVSGLVITVGSIYGAKHGVKEQINKDIQKIDFRIKKLQESMKTANEKERIILQGEIDRLREMKRELQ